MKTLQSLWKIAWVIIKIIFKKQTNLFYAYYMQGFLIKCNNKVAHNFSAGLIIKLFYYSL